MARRSTPAGPVAVDPGRQADHADHAPVPAPAGTGGGPVRLRHRRAGTVVHAEGAVAARLLAHGWARA